MSARAEAAAAVQAAALAAGRAQLVRRLNVIINPFAARDDLLLTCLWNPYPQPGQPQAPAWFAPKDSTVTINAAFALGDTSPAQVNPLTPAGRIAHPEIVGLCAHEAGHAHSTRWPNSFGDSIAAEVAQAAVLLEEPRVEYRQLQRRPQDRAYLRAQSVLIDLTAFANPDDDPVLDRWRAASVAVMVLARIDAGVLDAADGERVEPLVRATLGDDLDRLGELWREVFTIHDGDVAGLLDVASRWVDVLGSPPGGGMPLSGCAKGILGAGFGPPGENDDDWDISDLEGPHDDGGGAEKPGEEPADGLLDAVKHAHAQVNAVAKMEIATALFAPSTQPLAKAKQKAADNKQQKKSAKQAEKTFGVDGSTDNALGAPRPPTEAEMRLARQIAQRLRKAQFRERSRITRRMAAPPGRLSGREAMLGVAQRSMRAPITAKPFTATIRRHTTEPPISAGIMVDNSASMSWATEVMTTTAWAFSQAVNVVHGKTATVVFGCGKVTPITRVGRPAPNVTPFKAPGVNELFGKAFTVLDGVLNLTMGDGVRILVVVSDGLYKLGELAAAADAVAQLTRNGAHVLWVGKETSLIPPGATPLVVESIGDVAGLPQTLTKAFADLVAAKR